MCQGIKELQESYPSKKCRWKSDNPRYGGWSGASDLKHKETQVLLDLFMMFVNGSERDEQEWRKIFFEAGFSDYKIIPVLGVRSIIEVYP